MHTAHTRHGHDRSCQLDMLNAVSNSVFQFTWLCVGCRIFRIFVCDCVHEKDSPSHALRGSEHKDSTALVSQTLPLLLSASPDSSRSCDTSDSRQEISDTASSSSAGRKYPQNSGDKIKNHSVTNSDELNPWFHYSRVASSADSVTSDNTKSSSVTSSSDKSSTSVANFSSSLQHTQDKNCHLKVTHRKRERIPTCIPQTFVRVARCCRIGCMTSRSAAPEGAAAVDGAECLENLRRVFRERAAVRNEQKLFISKQTVLCVASIEFSDVQLELPPTMAMDFF